MFVSGDIPRHHLSGPRVPHVPRTQTSNRKSSAGPCPASLSSIAASGSSSTPTLRLSAPLGPFPPLAGPINVADRARPPPAVVRVRGAATADPPAAFAGPDTVAERTRGFVAARLVAGLRGSAAGAGRAPALMLPAGRIGCGVVALFEAAAAFAALRTDVRVGAGPATGTGVEFGVPVVLDDARVWGTPSRDGPCTVRVNAPVGAVRLATIRAEGPAALAPVGAGQGLGCLRANGLSSSAEDV